MFPKSEAGSMCSQLSPHPPSSLLPVPCPVWHSTGTIKVGQAQWCVYVYILCSLLQMGFPGSGWPCGMWAWGVLPPQLGAESAADEGNLALGGWNQGPSRWARLAQTQGHVALSGLPPNAPRSAQGGGAARPPSALFLPQEGRPQVKGAGGGDPRKQMGQ